MAYKRIQPALTVVRLLILENSVSPEFQYRFNRRYRLKEMLPRLVWLALRTPTMPRRLLMTYVY